MRRSQLTFAELSASSTAVAVEEGTLLLVEEGCTYWGSGWYSSDAQWASEGGVPEAAEEPWDNGFAAGARTVVQMHKGLAIRWMKGSGVDVWERVYVCK